MLDITPRTHYNKCSVIHFRVWRSLVSRLVRVQEAVGSNPATRTMRSVLIGSEYPTKDTPHFLLSKLGQRRFHRTAAIFQRPALLQSLPGQTVRGRARCPSPLLLSAYCVISCRRVMVTINFFFCACFPLTDVPPWVPSSQAHVGRITSDAQQDAGGGGNYHHQHGDAYAAYEDMAVGVFVVEAQHAEHEEEAGRMGQGIQAAGGDGGQAV